LSSQKQTADKKKDKKVQRASARYAMKSEGMKELREQLKLHSRKQVMGALVPGMDKVSQIIISTHQI